MNELTSRYANALYSLKKESKELLETQQEIKDLRKILRENPRYISLLSSRNLSVEKRLELVEEAFHNIDVDVKNFIKVIVENNRSDYLLDIFSDFNSLVNEYRNIMEGLLYSSEALTDSQIQNITSSISKREGRPVELKNIIDPSLIGGVKVVINDHIYDGSIKHHLEQMKISLLK